MLLVAVERQRQVVAACCEAASAAGVAPGMALSAARVVVPRARIEEFRADRLSAALRALAAWSSRFSPLVAVDEDGLLIDVTGCERVFGGEDRLVALVASQYAELGIKARAAIAPSFACACAAARYTRASTIGEGRARAFLEPLPIAALRMDPAAVEALAEVGIERIGQVLDLPRALLPARFGDGLLLRLDEALGRALEIIRPVRPVPPPAVGRAFDGPTTQWEAIAGCARMLLDELCVLLVERGCGVRRLEVTLVRSDLAPAALHLTLARPCRDRRHLWSLVAPNLERAHLGFGVEGVRVRALHIAAMPHEQAEQWGEAHTRHETHRAALIDTLLNRFGPDRVLAGRLVESHLPERAGVLVPIASPTPEAPATIARADRPSLLLDDPVPAEVVSLVPDGPLVSLRTREGERRIVATIGPERIGPEWWREREPARDYFKVQDAEGRWWWVYRHAGGGWFVHGVWA